MKQYLSERLTEQVITFELDGKSEKEVRDFLDFMELSYTFDDGIFYVEDEGDEEEKEELEEASAKRKIVIRKGAKKIIFKCGPGKKKVGKMTCVVRKSSELIKMKRRAIRSAKKSRSKRSQANRKRKRSNVKRSMMGLNRRKR